MGGEFSSTIILMAVLFGIMYFLMIRPQQKRMQEHKAMISSIRRGDQVVTSGGILGKVTKVIDDNEAMVEIAEGVRVRVVKATVTDVRSKGEAAAAKAAQKAASKPAPKAANDAD